MLKGLDPLLPPDLAGIAAELEGREDTPYACFLLIKGVIA